MVKKNNIQQILVEIYNEYKNQLMREAGKSGFGIISVADIRKAIKNNTINAAPLKNCFKIFYENGIWTAVFVFQAFTKTPSNLTSKVSKINI